MTGKLEITILGCGSSGGVPRLGEFSASDSMVLFIRASRLNSLISA
ncbi:MAG TPA: hypothetical protein VGC27_12335 [Rhizomicrobium sp.]